MNSEMKAMGAEAVFVPIVNELIASAEWYRKQGKLRLAQMNQEYALALIEKYDLPKPNLLLQRLLDLVATLDEVNDVQPSKAGELNRYLNSTTFVLRDWANEILKASAESSGRETERDADEINAERLCRSSQLVNIDQNAPVSEAIDKIITHRVSQLPVVDESDHITGLLTKNLIVEAKEIQNGYFLNRKVKEILPADTEKQIGTVSTDTCVTDVLSLFWEGAHAIIVVDPNTQERRGIITATDLLEFLG